MNATFAIAIPRRLHTLPTECGDCLSVPALCAPHLYLIMFGLRQPPRLSRSPYIIVVLVPLVLRQDTRYRPTENVDNYREWHMQERFLPTSTTANSAT